MTMRSALATGRKDLQDLMYLPRSALLSYLQKQSRPWAPRPKVGELAAQPRQFPKLAGLLPQRFVKWIWEYLSHRLGRRHAFQSYPAEGPDRGVYPLEGGDEIRIALAGDWGTGTDEAYTVGELIKKFDPHYSIHLGDVYYVGDEDEVKENFLGEKSEKNDFEPCTWPPGRNGTFALNGNHEMYALGYAYFRKILPRLGPIRNGAAQQQKASYFCLENEHWRIIALDTAYNSIGWPLIEYVIRPDCALRPEQIDWLRTVVRLRKDDPRGIIILGHHQYYSLFDDWYTKQAEQLAEFISGPVLWFWGHEHRLAIYPEFQISGGIRAFGRCIGHGGMPVDLPGKPKHKECPVEFVDRRPYADNDENLKKIGINGYAQLVVRGNRATVRYIDLHDVELFREVWTVANGALTRTERSPAA